MRKLDTKDKSDYCTLYIVRHGEAVGNVEGIVMGHYDLPLTENGEVQAEALGQEFTKKNIKIDKVFSSDLLRAKRTAEIVAIERKLAVKTTEKLRERFIGKHQGNKSDAYRKLIDEFLLKWQNLSYSERKSKPIDEGVETDEALQSRFTTYLRELAVAHPSENLAVFTHGGCIKGFIFDLEPDSYARHKRSHFKNTGYIKVLSDGVDFFLEEINGFIEAKDPNS